MRQREARSRYLPYPGWMLTAVAISLVPRSQSPALAMTRTDRSWSSTTATELPSRFVDPSPDFYKAISPGCTGEFRLWRCGESNPGPLSRQHWHLRAQSSASFDNRNSDDEFPCVYPELVLTTQSRNPVRSIPHCDAPT